MAKDNYNYINNLSGGVFSLKEAVEHPSHYKLPNGVECKDVVQYYDFYTGSAIKYLWRAGKKEKSKEIEDLKKAAQNIKYRIEFLEKQRKEDDSENPV
jgi:hypothetical protein